MHPDKSPSPCFGNNPLPDSYTLSCKSLIEELYIPRLLLRHAKKTWREGEPKSKFCSLYLVLNRLPTQTKKDVKALEMIPELSLLPNTTHPDVVRI